ncbi:Arsenite efflux pump ArsB, ACR3 family [Paucidesulfovibrio gracilis DSM 16080]|uniref:Arsenite efflux pump ArsB, ACR3 family n=1 Tax=Paucidesulfovibrio gracilis DSM 16080 TaxID=1121449 RepID=A0A1T4WXG5_9BACT|nr:bile acid:sodium symporter [Paucidesulfovibrio gracilis]SKA81909.1 Arsenite efflux pump ArsB, ACR3 family [Paucidesulfovibrio gracilis DSM 16080]
MWKTLAAITRNLTLAIPALLILGFLYGLMVNAAPLKALIAPFTFLMVFPMMVTLDARRVFEGGDIKAQTLAQAVNFGIIPLLAFGLGMFFFHDAPAMALGLLLAGLVPTSGMTISWTGLARGNVAAAVKMTVLGLTLGSLLTPLYVKSFLGAALEVNMMAVATQIGLIVFLPLVAGQAVRHWMIRRYGRECFRKKIAPKFPVLSTLGVLGIVFIAMALKARAIAAAPEMLPAILVPLVLLYAVNFLLSTLLAKTLLPRGDGIALVYGTVMRNLSIALAIAINAFGEQGSGAALVIALAYVVQVQAAAWYVRFTAHIYGPAPA